MITSAELRQKYLDFLKSRGHSIIPSASLLPENDPSLLFTNSGMSPLVPYLLGEKHPEGSRLANSQKCFRSEDIDEVGDSRHTTFFEMLGNWSLGDYFKEEQLNWWFDFLIDELKLDPKRLYQTVYGGNNDVKKDSESIGIAQKIFARHGIVAEVGPETKGKGEDGPGVEIDFSRYKIFSYKDKNWWQRGDAVGELGGPDSETFYDTGKEHDPKYGKHCHLNCDCGRFIEIGNSVFMQYQKTEDGWSPLTSNNVDFGGGLVRLLMFLQNKTSIFQTDLYEDIINKIEELSDEKYEDNEKAFEIIADHLKAATFIMGDEKGIAPSNIGQGYIVRRLIRRAIRYGTQLNIRESSWTNEIAKITAKIYEKAYPEIQKNIDFVLKQLNEEESKFNKTIEMGQKEFDRWMSSAKSSDKVVPGEIAFRLFSTYGYPIEMTVEMAKEKGKKVDLDGFEEEMKKHQELSRTASAGTFKGGLADASEQTTKLHTAAHLLLAALRKVLGSHVTQKGSNITAERLRFDFSHNEKLTDEQKDEIEKLVNGAIGDDLAITCEEVSLKEAKESGAMGVFESKYDEKVKVYTVGKGDQIFSKEICGGPHVEKTGMLGKFKIKKEQSSSAGIRRIKAVLED